MKEWFIYNIFNKEKNLFAGTTTKDEAKEYKFSLALHTGEEKEKILENRAKFASFFPNEFRFVSLLQVHSSRVINLDSMKLTQKWTELELNADGFVTSKADIMLTILTADCIALLAYDKKSKIVGAAHAGWRGTKDNIAKNLITAMQELGAKAEDIIVAISPSIRACCYEVDESVAKHFTNYPDSLVQTAKDKWHLDISIVNKEQLLELGIKEENIEISSICTACNTKEYFSYRKECACSGRFISFIGRKS
jgi:YfiH family protein